jgi:hypothetical protein
VVSSLRVLSWGIVVYYESIKREVKTRPMCRCDERLKTKDEESTRLGYTGFIGELTHPKTKTRFIDLVVYYESINRELKTRPLYVFPKLLFIMNREFRNLHVSHTLGSTTKQTRNT